VNASRPDKPHLVVICGPTGVGKTAFAIALARRFKGEIVGADSMQIYRRLNIGTAKPTRAEQNAVRHHMVDVVEPNEAFDAARYAAMAHRIINGIVANGRLPFVVGGTGLYIKALLQGLFNQNSVDHAVRERLKAEVRRKGSAHLHQRLGLVDPEAADRIHPNDALRVVRALEIFEQTGRPISAHQGQHRFEDHCYTALKLGLTMERCALYGRIDARVDEMLAAGLLEEVQNLRQVPYDCGLKSMQSLGYRHMIAFIEGNLAWPEVVRQIKRDHRRYAKRQLTWFGADRQIHWLAPHQLQEAARLIEAFIPVKV